MRRIACTLGLCLLLAGARAPAADPQAEARATMALANRVTFGVNASALDALRRLGRDAYLERELAFHGDTDLPQAARARIAALEITRTGPAELLARLQQQREQRREDTAAGSAAGTAAPPQPPPAPGPDEQAAERRIIRALYSPYQVQELLTWFWFNHFNVFQGKGPVRALIPDYEEQAIRPHVLGRFRDLLMATLTHPAMLVYLDNAQNAEGAGNENYARELMELHTLGVDGGYTQKDVQELARILTGVGVNLQGQVPPRPNPRRVDRGLFAFYPARHDHGEKTFLGVRFAPGGDFEEVEAAVDLLCRHPSTARFVSRKLARFFLGDDPPEAVVKAMARTFRDSDGDIAGTLRTLFGSAEFRRTEALPRKFKDPVQYVLSALRLFYDGQVLQNYRPVVHAFAQLGEPLYGHQTPDGYGLRETDWASSGQLARRFEIARMLAGGAGRLFVPLERELAMAGDEANLNQLRREARQAHHPNVPELYALLLPTLSAQTRQALGGAEDFQSWGTLLLSAPEFMYR